MEQHLGFIFGKKATKGSRAKQVSLSADSSNRRYCISSILPVAALLCVVFFITSTFITTDHGELQAMSGSRSIRAVRLRTSAGCENQCRRPGTEALPEGIVSAYTNLEMRPLWDSNNKRNAESSKSLLAMAVGIKQKAIVDKIVKKFPLTDFAVMLFHYDGNVDAWRDLRWCDSTVHVSAVNQTKWWFAKRFLHPDTVSTYNYIFLWDEDIGVENFDPNRYLSIVEDEGLEISQPALDPTKTPVHHQITIRSKKTRIHRRIYKYNGGGRCYQNSTAPPCTGWVEMMAPVFSKSAWRCVWHMIQSDLIHAWGLDMKLGYCAQGDRSQNVGVVDEEYIVHYDIATLGGHDDNKLFLEASSPPNSEIATELKVPDYSRTSVRRQSVIELERFKRRWRKSVQEDKCWADPYQSLGKS